MIQDYGELLKGYIEIVVMIDDIELDLDKSYLKYSLSFICILFVIYENQNYQAFRFGYININIVVISDLLPNFCW